MDKHIGAKITRIYSPIYLGINFLFCTTQNFFISFLLIHSLPNKYNLQAR